MIAVLVPVLGRPHRVAALVESVATSTPAPHRVVFVASAGDTAEHDAVRATGADLAIMPARRKGDYAAKINHGINITDEPLLFMGADDLVFHPGWYEAAIALLDGTVGVVGTNDMHNRRVLRGEHATHLLFTRDYVECHGTIDEAGKLLHEGYWHEFVDDECVQTAKARGRYAHAHDSHVEHLHPLYGGREPDQLDAEHARRMRFGREVFERRQHLWTSPSLSAPSATTAG